MPNQDEEPLNFYVAPSAPNEELESKPQAAPRYLARVGAGIRQGFELGAKVCAGIFLVIGGVGFLLRRLAPSLTPSHLSGNDVIIVVKDLGSLASAIAAAALLGGLFGATLTGLAAALGYRPRSSHDRYR